MKTSLISIVLALAACAGSNAETKSNVAVEANADFAFDLYAELAKENAGENLFFSPYSVTSALAMTVEGARGETAFQMGEVLRYPESMKRDGERPWDMDQIHAGLSTLDARFNRKVDEGKANAIKTKIDGLKGEFKKLKAKADVAKKNGQWKAWRKLTDEQNMLAQQTRSLELQVDPYELNVANALWAEKSYPFKDDYFAKINKFYKNGGVFPADFVGNPEKVRLEINSWVEGITKDRIKDLIPERALGRITRLVLVNAIYFKGDWSIPFEEENTHDLDFTLADGKVVKKPIMHESSMEGGSYAAFNADGSVFNTPTMIDRGQKVQIYPSDDGFAMVELPYKGDDLSMVVIAPNDPGGLGAIEEMLSADNVNQWIGALTEREVDIYLPKFKCETDYTMGDSGDPATLQKLGMVRAFVDPVRAQGAEFDGMTHATDPANKLYISKVLHKAFIEVNEKGTEAAAATAVVMQRPAGMPMSTPFTPTFKADRPFIYLIRDRVSGSILFLGRMNNPST